MPENPIEALKDYFGAYNENKWNEVIDLREKIVSLQSQNDYLHKEISELQDEIEIAIEEKQRLEEEELERQRLEDEKKNKGKRK